MFSENESFSSYAKIQGLEFVKPITKLIVYLGREPISGEFETNEEEEFITISDNKRISRKHIMIYFDKDKTEWYIRNLSKNDIIVNKIPLTKDDEPRLISPISAIQLIDECRFYFFQSKEHDENDAACVSLN